MGIPSNTAPWPIDRAAQEVKSRVDRLVKQCKQAKADIGTNYDEMAAIPAYIVGLNSVIAFVTVDCGYTQSQLGNALVSLYGSGLDWATDVEPSYVALKETLPSVLAGIVARQAEIGSLLKIDANGKRTLSGDAGETVNIEFEALIDSVLENFEG